MQRCHGPGLCRTCDAEHFIICKIKAAAAGFFPDCGFYFDYLFAFAFFSEIPFSIRASGIGIFFKILEKIRTQIKKCTAVRLGFKEIDDRLHDFIKFIFML